jgi:hypothetical protein
LAVTAFKEPLASSTCLISGAGLGMHWFRPLAIERLDYSSRTVTTTGGSIALPPATNFFPFLHSHDGIFLSLKLFITLFHQLFLLGNMAVYLVDVVGHFFRVVGSSRKNLTVCAKQSMCRVRLIDMLVFYPT